MTPLHSPNAADPALAHAAQPALAELEVGVGWRQPHYREVLETRPALGFLEVHSENFFAPGSAARITLARAREHYPISLHGVGLALGSACGLDAWHLDQLAMLVEAIDPVRVSDHAAFARASLSDVPHIVHGADLLPIAFNAITLDVMAAHVDQVQARLRRRILVENLSAYLHPSGSSMAEAEFFNRLCARTGCGMLLDVNNLVVNALNARRLDPDMDVVATACAYVHHLDAAIVGEIHLAGHHRPDPHGNDLVIDDHSSVVPDSVWAVYRCALAHVGPQPTLIEWDTDLPPLSVLLDQAQLAHRHHAEIAHPWRLSGPSPSTVMSLAS